MEKLLLERVYTAIIMDGNVVYSSTALDKHIELLKLFSITEFKPMKPLAHAFPLPGTNLAIFKLTDQILVAIYTKKGYQGQLLSFKTKISKYIADFDSAVQGPVSRPVETGARGQILPTLTQTVSLTLGLSEDESAVLKLCNGSHSIKEIIDKTRVPRKKVIDIIRHFETKEWLKLETKGEAELIPISIKKFPETAVRLGMISKKSFDINELCDGRRTCKDISEELIMSERELQKILEKMEKNNIIKMTVKIPEEEPETATAEVKVKETESLIFPELNIKPTLTANISFSLGFDEKEKRILTILDGSHAISEIFDVTQIPFLEILKIIIKYEEKGWIRVPIDEFKHIVKVKEILKSEYKVRELEEKYLKLMKERAPITPTVIETGLKVQETPVIEINEQEREALLYRIKQELPLMPIDTQIKLTDKLIKVSAHSREAMLEKVINSESSKKFKPVKQPEIPLPIAPAPITPPIRSIPVLPPAPSISPTLPESKPSFDYETKPAPVIDETPLLRPSQILERENQSTSATPPPKESILPPLGPQILSSLEPLKSQAPALEDNQQSPAMGAPLISEKVKKGIPGDEERINEVLEFIDSLLGIPEIIYLALIDYDGSIFYQSTKEANLWDITKDITKLVQNWRSQSPSVFLGGAKFASIKASPEVLIATSIQGLGHIIAIPINENLFILTKLSKEGDAHLISDDIAIVAKQINEMFQKL